jgi:hypothetical protein
VHFIKSVHMLVSCFTVAWNLHIFVCRFMDVCGEAAYVFITLTVH